MTEPALLVTAPRVITGTTTLDDGWVRIRGGRVVAVGQGPVEPEPGEHQAAVTGTVIPGMIDIHCHGGGGAAFTDGAQAAQRAAEVHLAHGTTSIMASLVTDSIDELARQIDALAPLVASGQLLGVHLEGPWISRAFCGAHDVERLVAPEFSDIQLLVADGSPVLMVTMAPELPGAMEAIAELRRHGVTVAVGHTAATLAQTEAAFAAGAGGMTHLFNAMRPVHHREPGPVWAAARGAAFLELIADGIHLHPDVVGDMIRRFPSRSVLITDAMAAAGAADGSYQLGPLSVTVTDGRATIAGTDTIAGSVLTLDAALRFAVQQAGVPLELAVRSASVNPAAALGLTDRGTLAPGLRADLVVLDDALAVRGVMRGGEWIRCRES